MRTALVAVMMAASAITAQPPATAPASPRGDAARGKTLFTSYGCYQCHGYAAQGGAGAGPRLAPRPIPFASFSKYLRTPSGDMPPYTAKVVADQDVADLYAFLAAVPPPPALDTVPLLK